MGAGLAVSGIVTELMSFLSAPTACLILIVVGYELSLKVSLLRPVLTTVALRLAVMAALCAAAALVVFRFLPFDKLTMAALLVLFSLPAPFIIPLFADVGDDAEYVSTSYSAQTLATMLCFVGIAVYTMA